jgi:hypothetical protein
MKVESEERSDEDENENGRSSRRTASNRQQSTRLRLHTTSDDDNRHTGDESRSKRVSRRPKRYESDQSFHVERGNTRGRATIESDGDSDRPRTTRESARKKIQEWAVTSDDNDDDDDENENNGEDKPQTSTQAQKSSSSSSAIRRSGRTRKTIQSDSEQSDHKESSSKAVPSRRSTRARVSQSQEDDDDDESSAGESDANRGNQPSTSTNVRHSNRLVNGSSSSSVPSRTTRTRSSLQVQANVVLRNDHNYGEPGPSSSSSIASAVNPRQTRSTILSRHQRNADELDRSNLEEIPTTSNVRLLRLRSANLRAAPTPSSNFEALNGIRRTTRVRTNHNYFEAENEVEEEEHPVVQQVQSRITNRAAREARLQDRQQPNNSNHHHNHSNRSDDSDSYSEEDKTPLKMMQSSGSKRTHEHNTRNGTSTSSSSAVNRVKRNLYSDDNNSDHVINTTF